MKPELSALLDGQLDSHEARGVLADLGHNESLRVAWSDYQLIGDVLRREGSLTRDVTARVLDRLADEPVVLAPQARRQPTWQRSIMALAASLAGVAVVGWLAFVPQEHDPLPPPLARAEQRPAKVELASAATGEMREYLAAHQTYAGGLPFQGSTQQIRTVSMAVAP